MSSAQGGVNGSDGTLDKLTKFVKDFVRLSEKKLDDYRDEAGVEGAEKTGKIGKRVVGPAGTIAGATLRLITGIPGAIASAVGKASGAIYNYSSAKGHKSKAKRVTEAFRRIEKDELLRNILVAAAGDIFWSFQSPFLELTDADGYWTRAMEKLAVDARDRAINYINDHESEIGKIDCDLITRGVILGRSKDGMGSTFVPNKAQDIPKLPKPGRTVFKDGEKWSTSQLYENIGLVTMKSDGTTDLYYRKKIDESQGYKYGYRLLFQWEREDSIKLKKMLEKDYAQDDEKACGEEYRCILELGKMKARLGEILSEMNEDSVMPNQILDAIRSGKETKQTRNKFCFNMRRQVSVFTGRAKELEDLHRVLQSEVARGVMPRVAAITGLGGVGKTELARSYVDKYACVYDGNSIWISADTPETLKFSFKELAEKLDIRIRNEIDNIMQDRDVKSIVEEVYEKFCEVKSLFIFDNAENFKDIKEFLPYSRCPYNEKTYVLITSRDQDWDLKEQGKIVSIPLKEFTPKEAETFVKDFLEIEDEMREKEIKSMEELTEELQYFPLALRQAVAYIKEEDDSLRETDGKGFEISNYLKVFHRQKRKMLEDGYHKERLGEEGEYKYQYHLTILTTWLTTLESIRKYKDGEHAIDILNVMAYLAPSKIYMREVFEKLIAEDEKKLWSSVRLLKRYSMAGLDKGVSDIHRLVQLVIRLRLEDEKREEGVLERTLGLLNSGSLSEHSMSHVTSVWTHASKYPALIRDYYFQQDSFSAYGYNETTPLHLLAEDGSGQAVKDMLNCLKEGFPQKFCKIINANDRFKRTPLYIAAQEGHACVVQHLVHNEATVSTKSSIAYSSLCTEKASGWTPLHIAAFNGHLDIVKILDGKDGTLVNNNDSTGRAPPILAASTGQVAIVKLLKPGNNEYLLHAEFRAAQRSGKVKDLENLLKSLAEENKLEGLVNLKLGEWAPLHLAAFSNWLGIVNILLSNGAEIRDTEDSFTPLHAASSNGHLDVVKCLISKGADPIEDTNKEGWTSLHGAVQNGRMEVVKYFIDDLEINMHVTDIKGDTPLHTAAFHGKLQVVEFLLERGANIEAINTLGATPLFYAAVSNHREVFKFLLIKGAKVISTTNGKTLYGRLKLSVLHFAAAYNDTEIIEDLIKRGVDKDMGKEYSLTPLHCAALCSSFEAKKCLIKHGADQNACINLSNIKNSFMDVEGDNALKATNIHIVVYILINVVCYFAALMSITPGSISELFEGSDRELCDGEQRVFPSVILKLIYNIPGVWNILDSARALVEERKNPDLNRPLDAVFFTVEGVGVNAKDADGNTTLHLAVIEGDLEFVKSLVNGEAGAVKADPSIQNDDQKTPLDLARDKLSLDPNNDDIKEIISLLSTDMDGSRSSAISSGDCSLDECLTSSGHAEYTEAGNGSSSVAFEELD